MNKPWFTNKSLVTFRIYSRRTFVGWMMWVMRLRALPSMYVAHGSRTFKKFQKVIAGMNWNGCAHPMQFYTAQQQGFLCFGVGCGGLRSADAYPMQSADLF